MYFHGKYIWEWTCRICITKQRNQRMLLSPNHLQKPSRSMANNNAKPHKSEQNAVSISSQAYIKILQAVNVDW